MKHTLSTNKSGYLSGVSSLCVLLNNVGNGLSQSVITFTSEGHIVTQRVIYIYSKNPYLTLQTWHTYIYIINKLISKPSSVLPWDFKWLIIIPLGIVKSPLIVDALSFEYDIIQAIIVPNYVVMPWYFYIREKV
jgi:hypothetical protein